MQDQSTGTLSKLLKVIDWLKKSTEEGRVRWGMKSSGFIETSGFGFTFRLLVTEVEVPEGRKIEVPGLEGGRAFAIRKVVQLFILKDDLLVAHLASFLHPVLERELLALADAVIKYMTARSEELLEVLFRELGIS